MQSVLDFTGGLGVDAVVITAATDSNEPIEFSAEACRTKGRIVWRYFAGTPLLHQIEVTPTSVYTLVDGVGVVSIDKQKGESVRPQRWAVKEAVHFLAEDEKHAYLETTDHAILAVDRLTGESKFKSKRHDYVAMALSPRGNTIYTITADGTLRATQPVFTAGKVGEMAMLGGNIEMQPVMASTH